MRGLVETLSRGAQRDIANKLPVPVAQSYGNARWFGRTEAAAGYLTYLNTYSTDSVVHPIVSRLAESTAGQEWKLWTRSKSGNKQDRRQINSHGVLDLLAKPNGFQDFSEIVESGSQHFGLVGETSIVLGFEAGIRLPIDMWVLRPDRIDPVPSAENFLEGWIYTSPNGGEKIPLKTSELLRMRRPSPVDPYRGMGAVQALLRDLDAQRHSKEWLSAFFENSAKPGGIIKVDRRLQDDEFDEMSRRWAEQHQGISKAHRVAILEQAEWEETAFSLRDMQMAELDAVGRDKALVAFGFPKSMLGIVEDVNRANAEAGEYVFARWLVRPALVRWRGMLNRQLLLPYFDPQRRYELDFEDPVPENGEAAIEELKVKGDVLVALTGAGFDSAQVLEFLDWPDLDFEKPEPEIVKVPSSLGGAPAKELEQSVDAAMRWVVRGHPDSNNTCEPCLENIGKTYRNREAAYADYPGGKSYIKCVGEQFGNHCRCSVIKRRSDRG